MAKQSPEYQKAWRLENKEKIAAYNRAYHLENKEKSLADMRVYSLENKEKIAAWNSAYRLENKEKQPAYQKTYYLKLNLANSKLSRRTLAAWATQIRERDTACLYCGSTFNLHAHHILSKAKHPEHALFLNNGITLCKTCHTQEHIINGDL